MIPDASKALSWLEVHATVLKGIQRGIERETLRVTSSGTLALTGHPKTLGAALTHRWITTDFAEALLEFITPVDNNLDRMLAFLRDIHRYVSRNLGEECMSPLSMPCFINANQDIKLAQFGSSNIGRMKTLYREGLKNRYGALMQTISGVHYNFSLPLVFWQEWAGVKDSESGKSQISAGYFRLIRNYYRFGWIIPYLFGASPVICSSFLKKCKTNLAFEHTERDTCYLPYATSLRISDLGYSNQSHTNDLGITFNDLQSYVACLKRAIITPSKVFGKLGIKHNDRYIQLNSNVLQIESELYAPIRPKRVVNIGETPSDALLRSGIEYIEVRSLDINPFSPIGVDAAQVRFLDLFLIWCVLVEAPEMGSSELLSARNNWNRVILEGRKPGQRIDVDCHGNYVPLDKVGKALLNAFSSIAQVLDSEIGNRKYQQVCDDLVNAFDDPELTFSSRILKAIKEESPCRFSMRLAAKYREMLIKEPLEILSDTEFIEEREASWQRQRIIEASDTLSFEDFIKQNRVI